MYIPIGILDFVRFGVVATVVSKLSGLLEEDRWTTTLVRIIKPGLDGTLSKL